MTLARIGMVVAGVGILLTLACASHKHFPESSLTGGVFEVKIDNSLTAQSVTAKRGDEVKWINMSNAPWMFHWSKRERSSSPVRRGLRQRIWVSLRNIGVREHCDGDGAPQRIRQPVFRNPWKVRLYPAQRSFHNRLTR